MREALPFEFPWRKIDSSQVKAVGFESKQFAFQLDKPKILNLLTGHTLYSNSNVVVRELIQNSLDATRLQTQIKGTPGEIYLHLDSSKRIVTVDDNGTGMTQRIIEDHFLNVGSSRYRDDSFRKEYPGFSAISRFGIGILSTFMISDEIEVITKSAAETRARNISIRSINGRYLIRLLDPNDEKVPKIITPHGTRVQLRLRAGVPIPELDKVARLWILFPGCKLTVQTDEGPVSPVGYSSPKHALEEALLRAGLPSASMEPTSYSRAFKVIEEVKEGVQLAFAVEWQPEYKNWAFVAANQLNTGGRPDPKADTRDVALCVQGVRVESSSPGFGDRTILAMANATGLNAPATNVARSGLEAGMLVDRMLANIYAIYAGHIAGEIDAMYKQRGFSISEAASEGRYLGGPLLGGPPSQQSENANSLLRQCFRTIPWMTIDRGENRSLVTVTELQNPGGFWTLESSAYTSAENFIRRMTGGVSLVKLAALSESTVKMPPGDILSGYLDNSRILELVGEDFEVDEIYIELAQRQASLHWSNDKSRTFWKNILPREPADRIRIDQILQSVRVLNFRSRPFSRPFMLQNSSSVKISGHEAECASSNILI